MFLVLFLRAIKLFDKTLFNRRIQRLRILVVAKRVVKEVSFRVVVHLFHQSFNIGVIIYHYYLTEIALCF